MLTKPPRKTVYVTIRAVGGKSKTITTYGESAGRVLAKIRKALR
jgi:hypothetical protein